MAKWPAIFFKPLPLALALALLFNRLQSPLDPKFLPPILEKWGTLQCAAGLLFAAGTAFKLARAKPALLTSGPYRVARHPIYLGLLSAFAGAAMIQGRPSGIAALLIVSAVCTRKIYREELALHARFGRSYEDYCRRTGIFLPWP